MTEQITGGTVFKRGEYKLKVEEIIEVRKWGQIEQVEVEFTLWKGQELEARGIYIINNDWSVSLWLHPLLSSEELKLIVEMGDKLFKKFGIKEND